MPAETVASAVIDFEYSGLGSGGCNESVDIGVKRKSENAWRFYYASRKRVCRQNSGPHVSRSSEANSIGSEDSAHQQPVSSNHVIRNIEMHVQHHGWANPDSAEASPRGTEFELSGMRFWWCKGNMDIQEKGKNQNACCFYYVRSKRMHSRNILKAKSHVGLEDFVYEHFIRSHDLVQDIKMGVQQHHLIVLNTDPTEAIEQNDSTRKDYFITHSGELPLLPVKQSVERDGDHAFEQNDAHNCSTICEDWADFRNCFISGKSGGPIADPVGKSSENLSRKAEEILAQQLLNASAGDKRNALHDKLDSLNISSSNHDKSTLLGQVLQDKLTHGQVHGSVATSENDHVDHLNCVLNMASEMDEDGGCSDSLCWHAINHHVDGHKGDVLLSAQDPKLDKEVCLGSQDSIFSATAVVSDILKPAQCREYSLNSLEVDESSIYVIGEISHEMMVCSLNREDPYIPWNDDLASSTVTFSSVICHRHKDFKSDASSPANNESKEKISLLKTEENQLGTSINYQIVEQHEPPDEGSSKLPASHGVKTVFPNIENANVVTKEEIDAPAETSPLYSEPEDRNFTEQSLMGESLKECNPMDDFSDGERSRLSVFHDLESSLSRPDDGECESDHDDSKLTDIWEMVFSDDCTSENLSLSLSLSLSHARM